MAVHTGLRVVDILFPVAGGQRELVIGDRQTGKTSILTATLLALIFRSTSAPSRKAVLCFLNFTGQRVSGCVRVFAAIKASKAFWFSAVVAAPVTVAMSAQYAAPLATAALAELTRNSGGHAFFRLG